MTNDQTERKAINERGRYSKSKWGKRQSAKRMRRMGKTAIKDQKENS